MTMFEFLVGVGALAIAGAGTLFIHVSTRRLEERLRRRERDAAPTPAE